MPTAWTSRYGGMGTHGFIRHTQPWCFAPCLPHAHPVGSVGPGIPVQDVTLGAVRILGRAWRYPALCAMPTCASQGHSLGGHPAVSQPLQETLQ